VPQLKWDETDALGFFEVVPTIEDYGVSHTYRVETLELVLVAQIWQLESVVELSLFYKNGEPLHSFVLFVHGELNWDKSASGECLRITRCYIASERFSYIHNPTLRNSNALCNKLTVTIKIKPSISIKLSEVPNS
jgi:hypothetical protein